MTLDQFPEIRAFVEDLCERACKKRLSDETGLDAYLTYLIGYACFLASCPACYVSIIRMVSTDSNTNEETIAYTIGQILIKYYKVLFATHSQVEVTTDQQTLCEEIAQLFRQERKRNEIRFAAMATQDQLALF